MFIHYVSEHDSPRLLIKCSFDKIEEIKARIIFPGGFIQSIGRGDPKISYRNLLSEKTLWSNV